MGRDRHGRDDASFAPSSGGRGGNGYVFCYFLFSVLLFSSSHCSCFPILSFFTKIINRGQSRSDWAVAAARTLAACPVLSAAGGAAATPPTIAIAW